MRKGEVKGGGLTHLMDYLFGFFYSSEIPYLTINCVTLAHQINIQQLIL